MFLIQELTYLGRLSGSIGEQAAATPRWYFEVAESKLRILYRSVVKFSMYRLAYGQIAVCLGSGESSFGVRGRMPRQEP